MPLIARAQRQRLRRLAARVAHELFIARLRVESWRQRLLRPRAPRIAATACWTFPIYSQTFVHQEVVALARAGFQVRFLYSQLGPHNELAQACQDLWTLKRRVILDGELAAKDFARYRRRMPGKVDELIDRLAGASGMTREEIERHEHVHHAFSFTRAVEAWDADYLHGYFFYERTLFTFVASFLLDIPRGVTCYADHVLEDYALKVVPLHLKTCDVVIATSHRIRRELEAIYGGPIETALVKANAIDAFGFTSGLRPYTTGPLRLLCVSRLDPKKGIEYLVDAVRILRARGLAAEVDIVGAPDAHSAESQAHAATLRTKVADLRLEEAVRFAGRRDSTEVKGFLAAAHVFVAPFVELPNGDKDGIPTAVLEAMAAGMPIVATTAGSMEEIIETEREGLLVPQRDGLALANAVERVAKDGALGARLAAAATERARREFDVRTSELTFHERIRATIDRRRRALLDAKVRS